MPKYKIGIPEVHFRFHETEADSIEEAIEIVKTGYGELVRREYTLTPEENDVTKFTVENVSTNQIYILNNGVWVPRSF